MITFVHECNIPVRGTLDGVPFEATFVITATGDTDDREMFEHGFRINHESASISIDGVGAFGFITSTETIVNNRSERVGFQRTSDHTGLFSGPGHRDFGTWDMLRSIGPVSGDDGAVLQWDLEPVQTTGGILFIDEEFELNVTFTATVIPNAPAVALLGPAALLLTKYARRRR